MKRITLALLLLFSVSIVAQQGINYKALIKDGSGVIVASTTIDVTFIILDGAVNVYEETHSPTTDANGIVILNIGEGTPVTGTFSTIDWSSTNHFLNVQIDTGSGLQDMGTTAFKTIPYAMQANTANTANTATTLTGGIDQAYIDALEARIAALEAQIPPAAVGDIRAGGVVFWVDPADNTHGLVCAIEDQSPGIQWYNATYTTTGATATAVGTGSANTTTIIANQGAVETDYAAGLARAYSGGGFDDWFLPSKDELNEMYVNKAIINATASANGGANFTGGFYWSSTEINNNGAWLQDFGNGFQSGAGKNSTVFVRAVRAF